MESELADSLAQVFISSPYQQLNSATHEIRILRIFAEASTLSDSGDREPIECFFEQVSLDDNPRYHALSYTWADEELGESFQNPDSLSQVAIDNFVVVDGQHIEVTPNLWITMWHLRRTARWHLDHPDQQESEFGDYEYISAAEKCILTAELPIWIDALCINQKDVQERNEQVSLMGALYQKAECVHVWLGPAVKDTELMVLLVKQISRLNPQQLAGTLFSMIRDPRLKRHWEALFSSYQRKYWRRLWIVQEFLLCSRTIVHVGLRAMLAETYSSIGFEVWANLLRHPKENDSTGYLDTLQSNYQFLLLADDKKNYKNSEGRFDFVKLLKKYRRQSVSNPRDLVYGLLGLAPSMPGNGLPIDYSMCTNDIYKATARYVIQTTQSLDIICNPERWACKCVRSKHEQCGLPSWIPDWRCLDDETCRVDLLHVAENPAFGDRVAKTDFSQDSNVLCCRGLLLGSIEYIQDFPDPGHNPPVEVLDMYCKDLVAFVMSLPEVSPGTKLDDMINILKTVYKIIFRRKVGTNVISNLFPEHVFLNYCLLAVVPDQLESTAKLLNNHESKLVVGLWRTAKLFCSLNAVPKGEIRAERKQEMTFGACYRFCKKGDVLTVIYGCQFPVALRVDEKDPKKYNILGEIYIPKYMNGEAVDNFEESDFEIC